MKQSVGHNINEYTQQLQLGNLPKAYKALMQYLMQLRSHFAKKYSTDFQVGSFYQGYMDMSYFAITPNTFRKKKLKFGLVFNHEKIRFEIWLVGQNKQVQKENWRKLKEADWDKYELSKTPQDSIIEFVLLDNPNFNKLELLTAKIEKQSLIFIKDITEGFNNL